MGKAIILSRVSTSQQDLTQQTEDVLREVSAVSSEGFGDIILF